MSVWARIRGNAWLVHVLVRFAWEDTRVSIARKIRRLIGKAVLG